MSVFLQNVAQEVKKARNLAYFSRYQESKEAFSKIAGGIEYQMLKISDAKLRQEWKKLFDEITNELHLVEDTISTLNGTPVKQRVISKPKEERPIKETKAFEKQFLVSDSQTQEEKKQPRYPFGKQPFKKYHDDDEVNQREQPEKDPLDWGPRPERQKKPYRKAPSNNNSHVNPKRDDYEKPWAVNANKKGGKGGKGDKKDEKPTYLKSVYPEGTGPDADLIATLEREVIDFNPGVTFDDIAELEIAKDLLYEAVIMPLIMPNYFKGLKKAWKGVLMFGPPGTGKTLLAKAIASTGKTTFFNVTAASFASKWRGQSQKLVRILFEMARFYAPTTLFIDEIDAIAAGSDNDSNNRKVLTQMLTSMDGANSDPTQDKKVVVIGATNRPWDLDEAIRRRLQKRIYIPLPTQIGRRQLLKICLKNEQIASDVDQEQIVRKTDGYSGADITNLCKQAAFMPMRRKLKNAGGFRKIQNLKNFQQQVDVPLTMDDFNLALKSCKPTVGNEHLQKYQKWMQQFGEKGGI